jgi:hypothetical protein
MDGAVMESKMVTPVLVLRKRTGRRPVVLNCMSIFAFPLSAQRRLKDTTRIDYFLHI